MTALEGSRNNEVSNGANRSEAGRQGFLARDRSVSLGGRAVCQYHEGARLLLPTLDGCVVGAAEADHILRCISPNECHATLLGDGLLLERVARLPCGSWSAYPLLASLFFAFASTRRGRGAVGCDLRALGGHFHCCAEVR